MFQVLIALYTVLLSHCSNPTQRCNRYYCPILQKRKPRTTQDKRVSQRHTFGQSQSSESNTGLPDSKVWILLIDLMPPTWLFTCSFLDCFHWKSYLFNRTINSTRARTMLPISFEYAWCRTELWVDAQKMFAKYMTAL